MVKICLQCGRPGFSPWVGKIPWRRAWLPTPVFLPGEFHGWRSLAVWLHGVSKSQTWLSNWHYCDYPVSWDCPGEIKSHCLSSFKAWNFINALSTLRCILFLNNSFTVIQFTCHAIHPLNCTVWWPLATNSCVATGVVHLRTLSSSPKGTPTQSFPVSPKTTSLRIWSSITEFLFIYLHFGPHSAWFAGS